MGGRLSSAINLRDASKAFVNFALLTLSTDTYVTSAYALPTSLGAKSGNNIKKALFMSLPPLD